MYVVWDTERINNTKIYMLAYILADENFNIKEKNIVIDNSIDLSTRNSPRVKKELLSPKSIVCNSFESFIKKIKPIILEQQNTSVCFGKSDWSSINDQLKLHNQEPISGKFYDVKELSTIFDIKGNGKCNNLGSFATMLGFEHEPHNPLSDSMLTLLLFKYLKKFYLENILDNYLSDIPNKKKVLDSKIASKKKKEV